MEASSLQYKSCGRWVTCTGFTGYSQDNWSLIVDATNDLVTLFHIPLLPRYKSSMDTDRQTRTHEPPPPFQESPSFLKVKGRVEQLFSFLLHSYKNEDQYKLNFHNFLLFILRRIPHPMRDRLTTSIK